jgi:hypothetical protein
MLDDLLEAWRTNNRINLFLIDHISVAGMKSTLSKRGGRDVARQFAHMHNVRVWHLEKRAKDLADGLTVFETKVTQARPSSEKPWPPPAMPSNHFSRESSRVRQSGVGSRKEYSQP